MNFYLNETENEKMNEQLFVYGILTVGIGLFFLISLIVLFLLMILIVPDLLLSAQIVSVLSLS